MEKIKFHFERIKESDESKEYNLNNLVDFAQYVIDTVQCYKIAEEEARNTFFISSIINEMQTNIGLLSVLKDRNAYSSSREEIRLSTIEAETEIKLIEALYKIVPILKESGVLPTDVKIPTTGTGQQIRIASIYSNKSVTKVAKEFGISQSGFSQRMKTGKFTRAELERIAEILGCKYVSYFEFPDGKRI